MPLPARYSLSGRSPVGGGAGSGPAPRRPAASALPQRMLTRVPKPKKWVSTIMPGMVASSTFCINREVLMGPWAWGEVIRIKAMSGVRSLSLSCSCAALTFSASRVTVDSSASIILSSAPFSRLSASLACDFSRRCCSFSSLAPCFFLWTQRRICRRGPPWLFLWPPGPASTGAFCCGSVLLACW